MKLHIGVESQSGLVHSAVVTAANADDKRPLPDLLHGNERRVYCEWSVELMTAKRYCAQPVLKRAAAVPGSKQSAA